VTADIVVVVPVLGRPGRVADVAESCAAAAAVPTRLLFVATRDDRETRRAALGAIRATGRLCALTVLPGALAPGDFARKVNHAFRITTEPWLFQAGDDVEFVPGWDVEVLTVAAQSGAGVVGTNDDANPTVRAGLSSTHSLIRRSYVDECGGSLDGPGVVFHEGYGHQYTDSELVELARSRGCYAHAGRAVVRHRHPFWGTATDDETYRRGQATAAADQRLFLRRRRAWTETPSATSGIL
jgi:hypothetical protein